MFSIPARPAHLSLGPGFFLLKLFHSVKPWPERRGFFCCRRRGGKYRLPAICYRPVFFWALLCTCTQKALYWRKIKLMPTDTKKDNERATIQVSKDFHKKLKIKAAKEGKTIKQLIEEKFKEG